MTTKKDINYALKTYFTLSRDAGTYCYYKIKEGYIAYYEGVLIDHIVAWTDKKRWPYTIYPFPLGHMLHDLSKNDASNIKVYKQTVSQVY